MKHKPLDGQLSFNFGTASRQPGKCEHEQKLADVGGGKSFCELMDAWTNCREVQHCVYERF